MGLSDAGGAVAVGFCFLLAMFSGQPGDTTESTVWNITHKGWGVSRKIWVNGRFCPIFEASQHSATRRYDRRSPGAGRGAEEDPRPKGIRGFPEAKRPAGGLGATPPGGAATDEKCGRGMPQARIESRKRSGGATAKPGAERVRERSRRRTEA